MQYVFEHFQLTASKTGEKSNIFMPIMFTLTFYFVLLYVYVLKVFPSNNIDANVLILLKFIALVYDVLYRLQCVFAYRLFNYFDYYCVELLSIHKSNNPRMISIWRSLTDYAVIDLVYIICDTRRQTQCLLSKTAYAILFYYVFRVSK